MQRLKLFAAMLGCLAVLAGTVFFLSPYAPVVEPVMEIEAVWAIEDARTESGGPLVTYLENGGAPLGYDAEENTFYCTLGLGQGEGWPEIHLTAPGAKGARLVFVDDYSYDWCADAIREGYAYQILCYTDTEFSYAQIVFTGLPIVTLHAQEEIGEADTQVEVSVSSFGHAPVVGRTRVHRRGGGSLNAEKAGYRVEFVRSDEGGRNLVDLPGLGLRDDMILGGMVTDELLMRDRLCWTIYGEMLGTEYDGGFDARKTAYAELFLNDEYRGVYLMMEPMNAEDELRKAGDSHLLTDSVYRSVRVWFLDERPVLQNPVKENSLFELRYAPGNADPFAGIADYVDLLTEEDDEVFCRKVSERMDAGSVARYGLLEQAAALADNVNNNLYFWYRKTPEGMKYFLVPWDMDMSWGQKNEHLGDSFQNWLDYPLLDRIVALNAGGTADLMVEYWKQWRGSIFSQEHIERLVSDFQHELTASGALWRNTERWELEASDVGAAEIISFAEQRFMAIDRAMEQIENSDGRIPPFLADIGKGLESYPMYEPDEAGGDE